MSNIVSPINPSDLPTDPADVEQDAENFFGNDIQILVDSIIILAQQDPTEVSLKNGLPRWTPNQMTVITKTQELLASWQD